jgi:hypothetical protein
MAKVKFVLNWQGVRELMKSKEMMDICSEYANNALARLGDGYEVNTYSGENRVNAEVYAQSFAAKRENLKSNTILKAVFGK